MVGRILLGLMLVALAYATPGYRRGGIVRPPWYPTPYQGSFAARGFGAVGGGFGAVGGGFGAVRGGFGTIGGGGFQTGFAPAQPLVGGFQSVGVAGVGGAVGYPLGGGFDYPFDGGFDGPFDGGFDGGFAEGPFLGSQGFGRGVAVGGFNQFNSFESPSGFFEGPFNGGDFGDRFSSFGNGFSEVGGFGNGGFSEVRGFGNTVGGFSEVGGFGNGGFSEVRGFGNSVGGFNEVSGFSDGFGDQFGGQDFDFIPGQQQFNGVASRLS